MPLYEYRCADCGHEIEVLRKISDPHPVECPTCHHASLQKKLTAAGFQLKGTGWYVTDFKGGNKPAAPRGDKPAEAAGGDAPAAAPAGAADSAPAATGAAATTSTPPAASATPPSAG